MIDKQAVLDHLDFRAFYREAIPSLSSGGSQASGRCPFHDDKRASFSVNLNSGSWKCHAGCGKGDAFDFYKRQRGVDFKAALKELADKAGVSDGVSGRREKAVYCYRDGEGKELYQVVRYEPKDFRPRRKGADGKWVYNLEGVGRVLYNLPEVRKAKAVIVVEGEKDVETLRQLGITATTSHGGANGWRPEYAESFQGKSVAIIPDNDRPGLGYAEVVAHSINKLAVGVRVVRLPGLEKPGADVSDWIELRRKEGRTDKELKGELISLIRQAPAWVPGEPKEAAVSAGPSVDSVYSVERVWDEPVLFGEVETPEIPCNLLPGFLGRYCQAVADNTQTPPGMVVMMGLSTVAACVQKRFEVSPYGDNYREPLNVWTVSGAEPGTRKTAIKTAMTAPLLAWEEEQARILEPQIWEAALQRDVSEKRIDQLKAEAAKSKITMDERDRLLREAAEIQRDMKDVARAPRLFVDDVTPEALQRILADHGERIALISDEGGIFEIMGGLYSKSGQANINVFLQAHAGASVRVDRQARMVTLRSPALTFGLMVQPEVLKDLTDGGKRHFRGVGALARFLYCLPESMVGRRDLTRRRPIPESVRFEYEAGIMRLLNIPPALNELGQEVARVLTLSKDALDSWEKFSQWVEVNQGVGGDFHSFRDWTAKLPGVALRIAGLFHIVKQGADEAVIDRETIEQALDLAEILIGHARAVFDLMGSDQTVNDAKHVLRWILTKGEREFVKRGCHKELEGRFRRVDRLDKALSVLTERNIISAPQERKSVGRPGIYFLVNPMVGKEAGK